MSTITINGIDALKARFRVIARKGDEILDGALESAAEIVTEMGKHRIEVTKASPEGVAWKPLNADYLAEKIAEGQTAGTLVLSGDLQRSLIGQITGRFTAAVTSNLDYAEKHQLGGTFDGKYIPARPYLGISGVEEKQIKADLNTRLRTLFA